MRPAMRLVRLLGVLRARPAAAAAAVGSLLEGPRAVDYARGGVSEELEQAAGHVEVGKVAAGTLQWHGRTSAV
jgi:hypothetical protein